MKRGLAWAVLGFCALLRSAAQGEEALFPYRADRQYAVDPAQVRYDEKASRPVRLEAPSCLAAWPDGRTVVAGAREWLLLDADGRETLRCAVPNGEATAVAVEGESVWLAARDRILRFDLRGQALGRWDAFGERAVITGLAAASNAVWVCDAGQRRVWRMDTGGRLLGFLPSSAAASEDAFVVPSPSFAVAACRDGSFWVVNPGRHRLQHHATDGSLLAQWSREAQDATGFSGCCNPAFLAVLPDGRLVTSEKHIARVKVYRPDGALDAFVVPPRHDGGALAPPVAADASGTVYVLQDGVLRLFAERRP